MKKWDEIFAERWGKNINFAIFKQHKGEIILKAPMRGISIFSKYVENKKILKKINMNEFCYYWNKTSSNLI